MNLDTTDRLILGILQTDGRASASHIAEHIGMSVPAVTERIRKLQDNGIIRGYQTNLDPRSIGLDVGAIITVISESSDHYNEVIQAAETTPEVVQCFSTTGRGSHVLIVRTQTTKTLETLLREIQMWPGVERTETQLILSSYIGIKALPLPEREL